MKTLWILLTFLTFFAGCSQNNAFSRFHMSSKQELRNDSILSSKVKNGTQVDGVVSVIYLNKVDPTRFNTDEYFYVSYYLKDTNPNVKFLLNKEEANSISQVKNDKTLAYLSPVKTKWNKYYIVKFKPQKDILSFVLENGQFSSDSLVFEKDE